MSAARVHVLKPASQGYTGGAPHRVAIVQQPNLSFRLNRSRQQCNTGSRFPESYPRQPSQDRIGVSTLSPTSCGRWSRRRISRGPSLFVFASLRVRRKVQVRALKLGALSFAAVLLIAPVRADPAYKAGAVADFLVRAAGQGKARAIRFGTAAECPKHASRQGEPRSVRQGG
jgi:hypothetical protein